MRILLAATLLALSSAAQADGTAAWLGVGAGVLAGNVSEPNCGMPRNCDELGVLGMYTVNLTYSTPQGALRIRGTRAEERMTLDDPRELAFLIGGRLNSGTLLMVGGGRLFNADDSLPEPFWGLALEMVHSPLVESSSGLEIGLQANIAPDLYYVGLSLGLRFGSLGGG